jgi:hypothetical protein
LGIIVIDSSVSTDISVSDSDVVSVDVYVGDGEDVIISEDDIEIIMSDIMVMMSVQRMSS